MEMEGSRFLVHKVVGVRFNFSSLLTLVVTILPNKTEIKLAIHDSVTHFIFTYYF